MTNPGTLEAVVDDPYILFSAEKIKNVQSIMPVLDKLRAAHASESEDDVTRVDFVERLADSLIAMMFKERD